MTKKQVKGFKLVYKKGKKKGKFAEDLVNNLLKEKKNPIFK